MRLVKMFGLAALAALAATALMSAGSASAKDLTLLCNAQHVNGFECPAGKATTEIHLVDVTAGGPILLNDTANVLCLHVLANLVALALGVNTQEVHVKKNEKGEAELLFANCGTVAAHNNCVVTVEAVPLYRVLKTALNLAVGLTVGGKVRVKCTILGFIKIDCVYLPNEAYEAPIEGALHTANAGHGMISLAKAPSVLVEGGGLCPTTSTVDALLEPLSHVWITGNESPPPPSGTALCKSHSAENCSEGNLVKNIHLITTQAPMLLNNVANVECEQSLVVATVLGLGTEPSAQKADVSEWTWTGCHTFGAVENCNVSAEALPIIDLRRTALNVGTATLLEVQIAVECNIFGLHEMACTFGGTVELQAEGALRKVGTGHGMITASKVVIKRLETGVGCPESIKWDALFEPLEHVYILS